MTSLVDLIKAPGEWALDGLCATADPDLWFPDKGVNAGNAKAICAKCPVVVECADWAIATETKNGIWGNLSERERRKFVRARRETA